MSVILGANPKIMLSMYLTLVGTDPSTRPICLHKGVCYLGPERIRVNKQRRKYNNITAELEQRYYGSTAYCDTGGKRG